MRSAPSFASVQSVAWQNTTSTPTSTPLPPSPPKEKAAAPVAAAARQPARRPLEVCAAKCALSVVCSHLARSLRRRRCTLPRMLCVQSCLLPSATAARRREVSIWKRLTAGFSEASMRTCFRSGGQRRPGRCRYHCAAPCQAKLQRTGRCQTTRSERSSRHEHTSGAACFPGLYTYTHRRAMGVRGGTLASLLACCALQSLHVMDNEWRTGRTPTIQRSRRRGQGGGLPFLSMARSSSLAPQVRIDRHAMECDDATYMFTPKD